MEITAAVLLVAGIALGGGAVYLWHRKQNPTDANNEQFEALSTELSEKVLKGVSETFLETSKHLREQSQDDLQHRRQAIENLVKPLKEALNKTERQIREIEKERKQDQGSLREQLEQVSRGQQRLQTETGRLVQALKKPQVRGRWGEMTLRNAAELAGMIEHCDFEEQARSDDPDNRLRPDMIVHLPNERRVIVDAKTPLDAYLASLEADTEEERGVCLERHAQQLAARVRELASKSYQQQFEGTLDFVVMFVPGDQFLSPALERDHGLMEKALRDHVVLASPTTLFSLLRAIAYGWRQKKFEENAQQIQRLGEELYKRSATFTEHLGKIGAHLGRSVGAYNDAVGSLERNLLSSVRKFPELGIPGGKEIPETKPVETAARALSATERNEDA